MGEGSERLEVVWRFEDVNEKILVEIGEDMVQLVCLPEGGYLEGMFV